MERKPRLISALLLLLLIAANIVNIAISQSSCLRDFYHYDCAQGGYNHGCCDCTGDLGLQFPDNGPYCNWLADDNTGWEHYDRYLDFTKQPIESIQERCSPRGCIKYEDRDRLESYTPNHICCGRNVAGNRYRMGLVREVWFQNHTKTPWKELSNRLRFSDAVIAQEGISFCIVGRHFKRSQVANWGALSGFRNLAIKSFDIGNHIDPEDSGKMNTFERYSPDELRKTAKPGSVWTNPASIPDHEFEYVWMGTAGRVKPAKLGWEKRPAHPEFQPHKDCRNPYKVSVTMIEVDGLPLHNHLHIKVYSEPVSQPNGNCPTGKMKLLMLEVRDQDGLPVGQFTDFIPCDQDDKTKHAIKTCPNGVECKAHYGVKKNFVPCMFSHPKSSVHPYIFMASAVEGSSDESAGGPPGQGGGTGSPDICRDSTKPQSQRNPPTVSYQENSGSYFTEVHATWRFAQYNPGWTSELHFATLIIEDDTPIQYYTSRMTEWHGIQECRLRTYGSEKVSTPTPTAPWAYTCRPPVPCCWYWAHTGPQILPLHNNLRLAYLNTCVNGSYNTNRPYGFSARYAAIKPTFKTRGGWDFFQKRYIRPAFVDCHVDISYDPDYYYTLKDEPGISSKLPLRRTLKEYLRDHYTLQNPLKFVPADRSTEFDHYSDGSAHDKFSLALEHRPAWYLYGSTKTYDIGSWHTYGITTSLDDIDKPPSKRLRMLTNYYSKSANVTALKVFRSVHQDPIVVQSEFPDYPAREYFGSEHLDIQNDPQVGSDITALQTSVDNHDQEFTCEEMMRESKSRCPCPFVPTTLPPELQTKTPVEIEGRRLHAVQMLIAWVILVPLSFFVARFYKETYSKVFFLQEFWWYSIHFLCLITALLFTVGGLYVLKIKRQDVEYSIVWTDATKLHIYGGYGLLGLFCIHLALGSVRLYDIDLRIIQIALHWAFGWLEYAVAVMVIIAAGSIPQGIFNCVSFGIYCGFVAVQILFTLGMEYHMRQVDKKLDLQPPRSYLPPPVMRIFHKDAPHAYFRVVMLGVFFLLCVAFYAAIHISMSLVGAENSCHQPAVLEVSRDVSQE